MRHTVSIILVAAMPLCVAAQKIKPSRIGKVRKELWAKHVKDVAAQTPQALNGAWPSLTDMQPGRHGALALPTDMESDKYGNAVTLNYFYGYKGSAPSAHKPSPLFMWLHGSGPRQQEWETGLQLCQRFDDAPSVYLIPQIPQEGKWYRWYQQSKQWAYKTILRQLLARADIDPSRLYLLGVSEGGYGSQRLASFYADYLAAAGPMAGGEPLKNAPAENLQHTAFSLRTGAKDYGFYRDQLTLCTKMALDSLQRLVPGAYRHWVETIPGYGHGIDYSPTPKYLSGFQRTALPSQFTWEDFEMDGIHRSGFYYLAVDRRPCDSLRTRYDVHIERSADGSSIIHIDVRNVHYRTTVTDPRWGIELMFARTYEPATGGCLTLFLDEHLVDLGKKVVLLVNGVERYAGQLTLDRRTLQRSIDLWGDPLRLLPAAITASY